MLLLRDYIHLSIANSYLILEVGGSLEEFLECLILWTNRADECARSGRLLGAAVDRQHSQNQQLLLHCSPSYQFSAPSQNTGHTTPLFPKQS